MKIMKRVSIVGLLVAVSWSAYVVLRMQHGLSAAGKLVERGDWKEARVALGSYQFVRLYVATRRRLVSLHAICEFSNYYFLYF